MADTNLPSRRLLLAGGAALACSRTSPQVRAPERTPRWIQPGPGRAEPLWGHAEGMRIGLHPLRGPRGLLRVYTPYMGQAPNTVINFIAVEPIPAGTTRRGLSELEPSGLDPGARGKRFWSTMEPLDQEPRPVHPPVPGQIVREAGVEALRVFIQVERFDSGAHVYLRLTFRADRPREVGIATFAHADSAPLDRCVASATMGNYARLRRLHLADDTVVSTKLWPQYADSGFAPHAKFALARLRRTPEGHAIATATSDEADPRLGTYAPDTHRHWHYAGVPSLQRWRSERPDERLEVWVNGRYTYWASKSPIPGGIAFENFEMMTPFQQGRELWFGVEPADGAASAG